jgi:hypothetical protein
VESNFGVFFKPVENDFKPSAYSISYLNNRTIGAVYCGRLLFDNADIEASVYARDGELFVIIWSKGEETEVTFEGETLTAADMNGNPLGSGSTFTIGEKPIYLTGISRKHITESLPKNIQKYLDLYVDTCFEGDEGKKGVSEATELIYSTVELAENFNNKTTLPTEEEALNAMREHYSVNKKLIDIELVVVLSIGNCRLQYSQSSFCDSFLRKAEFCNSLRSTQSADRLCNQIQLARRGTNRVANGQSLFFTNSSCIFSLTHN